MGNVREIFLGFLVLLSEFIVFGLNKGFFIMGNLKHLKTFIK